METSHHVVSLEEQIEQWRSYLRRRQAIHGVDVALEKWQMDYLPVYSAWAALVVILFPPLFRYI